MTAEPSRLWMKYSEDPGGVFPGRWTPLFYVLKYDFNGAAGRVNAARRDNISLIILINLIHFSMPLYPLWLLAL